MNAVENGMPVRRLRVALAWVLIALAGCAVYLSWGALYDLAIYVGGMSPARAMAFPPIVDLVTVAALLLALLVPNPAKGARGFAWLTLAVFGLVTVAGNAAHVVAVSPGSFRLGEWAGIAVNAIPAIALLMTTHLASVNVFTRAPVKEPVPVVKLAPRVARAPRPKVDSAAKETVLQLRGEGHSLAQIATMTGVSKTTVSRWVGPIEREIAWQG